MTTQAADVLIYKNKRYSIHTGYSESIINQEVLSLVGFNTKWWTTAIMKGYSATYRIIENKLVLDELYVYSSDKLKTINGIKPKISLRNRLSWNGRFGVYEGLNYEIKCTGIMYACAYDEKAFLPFVDTEKKCFILHICNGVLKDFEEKPNGIQNSSDNEEYICLSEITDITIV